MSFNSLLTKDSEPNSGECTIYNLATSTRNFISEGDKIEVYAGFDGNEKLISIGDIRIVNNRQPFTDWATTIEWGDGLKQYTEVNYTKSYKEGAKVSDIIKDLTSSLGFATKGALREIQGAINGGLSVNGKTKDILNKLTKDYGLEWSIQDEEVNITFDSKPVDDELILISQNTGLLEFPQVSSRGIDFTTQLNPDIRPKKLVEIKSAGFFKVIGKPEDNIANKVDGINIVETVRFSGDNYGGQFQAKVNCKEFNG